jgi:predicted cupin superfamily sugar epimerase
MLAAEIIATLGMQRHPEGGWYVETFRDSPQGGPHGLRGNQTAIYFLLEHGDVSHWHRVRDAAEIWHFHAGAPIELRLFREGGDIVAHTLGINITAGQRPQCVVPSGWWQTARSLGDWTLVGCTVSPGFEFAQFELAEPGWEPSVG